MTDNRTSRADVYKCIDGERDYQESLIHKSENDGGVHSVAEWILYMEDYIADARKIASHTWGPEAKIKCLDILRKVTAMGVVCMEQNGVVERSPAWKVIPRTQKYDPALTPEENVERLLGKPGSERPS